MKTSVLLIDDDHTYCRNMQKEASGMLLDLLVAHNLEDGLEMIESNRRLKAVILDGHCFLEAGQQGIPGANFVYHAFHRLDDLEREQKRVIPRCVNTEQPEAFREELSGLATLFTKNNDTAPLFRWIRQELSDLEEVRVMEQHPGIFSRSELFFSHLEEDELVDLLLFSENPDAVEIPARLAVIRRLLEKLTDVCSLQLLRQPPQKYANQSGVSVKAVFDALHSHRLISRHILKLVHGLYSYCSEFGTHIHRPSMPAYSPGIYAFRRNLNSLLEIVAYCSDLITNEPKA